MNALNIILIIILVIIIYKIRESHNNPQSDDNICSTCEEIENHTDFRHIHGEELKNAANTFVQKYRTQIKTSADNTAAAKQCLYGTAFGDITGVFYEGGIPLRPGETPDTTELIKERTHVTDDTIMHTAIAIAAKKIKEQGLKGDDCIAEYASTMKKFAKKYPNAGYGANFYNWAVLDEENEQYTSFGDGSAMRSGSIGVIFDSQEDVIKQAFYSAIPTHSHPEGIKGAIVTAMLCYMAKAGASKKDMQKYACRHYSVGIRTKEQYYDPQYRDEYGIIRLPADITVKELKILGGPACNVSCMFAVPEAISNFMNSDSFESCMRNVFRYPCDADTVAAISGGFAAIYYQEDFSAYTNRLEEIINRDIPEIQEAAG